MCGYQRYHIVHRNGFLHFDSGKGLRFRRVSNIERNIKYIAPEELPAGVLEIFKQNIVVDRNSLYQECPLDSSLRTL